MKIKIDKKTNFPICDCGRKMLPTFRDSNNYSEYDCICGRACYIMKVDYSPTLPKAHTST